MAAFVMQAMGCEVAALNTVQFSTGNDISFPALFWRHALVTDRATLAGNHTGYKQFKGTKASAQEIRNLYDGLKQSHLTDFDMMLSGYAPSADAVNAVGEIGRDLKRRLTKPGSFFWGGLGSSGEPLLWG